MIPDFTTIIQTTPVAIGALSLVLSYISHRDSAFDSRYERESKIDDKLDKIPMGYGEVSSDNYGLMLNYIKSTVDEDTPGLRGWGFLFPRANIQGETQLSFSIAPPVQGHQQDLNEGKYVAEVDDASTLLNAVGVKVESDTGGMVHVLIDSVDVDEVGSSISALHKADYSLSSDEERFERLFDSRTAE